LLFEGNLISPLISSAGSPPGLVDGELVVDDGPSDGASYRGGVPSALTPSALPRLAREELALLGGEIEPGVFLILSNIELCRPSLRIQ